MRRIRSNASRIARYGIIKGYRTAQERADALGISRSHILHLERGDGTASVWLMDRMAELYGRSQNAVADALREARSSLRKREAAADMLPIPPAEPGEETLDGTRDESHAD